MALAALALVVFGAYENYPVKTPVLGNVVPVLGTITGVVRILVVLQHRRMFSHIIGKLLLRPIE